MKPTDKTVIIISGPTASGKSQAATAIAKSINGVIINSDSAQIYKEVPILTAQPSLSEQHQIPHKLFGIISLADNFDVETFINLALEEIKLAFKDNLVPILVGGTGFYLTALLKGLSPLPKIGEQNRKLAVETFTNLGLERFKALVQKIDPQIATSFPDRYRLIRAYEIWLECQQPLSALQKQPPKQGLTYPFLMFKILPARIELYSRINTRFEQMLKNGALPEAEKVKSLYQQLQTHNAHNFTPKKIIGLNELISYLNAKLSLKEVVTLATQKSRNYAKRQITWFKNQFPEAMAIETTNTQAIHDNVLKNYLRSSSFKDSQSK